MPAPISGSAGRAGNVLMPHRLTPMSRGAIDGPDTAPDTSLDHTGVASQMQDACRPRHGFGEAPVVRCSISSKRYIHWRRPPSRQKSSRKEKLIRTICVQLAVMLVVARGKFPPPAKRRPKEGASKRSNRDEEACICNELGCRGNDDCGAGFSPEWK